MQVAIDIMKNRSYQDLDTDILKILIERGDSTAYIVNYQGYMNHITAMKHLLYLTERELISKYDNKYSITEKGQRLVSLTQKLQTVADSRILMSK